MNRSGTIQLNQAANLWTRCQIASVVILVHAMTGGENRIIRHFRQFLAAEHINLLHL